MDKEQLAQLQKELFRLIDALPQRDAIERDDAKQWVGYVSNVMPQEAIWHITCASGIGGSEIGGLVKNYLGHRADFMFSAHDWAESKLLKRTPELSGGALKRGNDMESLHRQRFHEMYRVNRDNEAFRIIASSHSQGRPWLRYSPDDLVRFNEPTLVDFGGRQIEVEGAMLIDYKAPSNINTDGASFQYACQLHQGALIAQDRGVELNGSILSQWDWVNWTVHNDLVIINPDLQELIKRASDYYWSSVLRAEIPEYVYVQRYSLSEEVKSDWQQAVERFSMLNALKTQLDNEAKKLRTKIAEGLHLDKDRLESQQIVFEGSLKISATTRVDENKIRETLPEDEVARMEIKNTTTSYNTDALIRHAKEQGIDVSQFRVPNKIDPEKAYEVLADQGLNPEEFLSETHRFLTDKAMNNKARSWVSENFPSIPIPEITPLSLTATEGSAALEDDQYEQDVPVIVVSPTY